LPRIVGKSKENAPILFLTKVEMFLQKIVEVHLIFLKTETMITSTDAVEQQ